MKGLALALVILAVLAFLWDGFFYSKVLVLIMAGLMFIGSLSTYADDRTGLINPWVIFALSFIQYYFLGPLDTFFFHDWMALQTVMFGHLGFGDDTALAKAILTSLIGLCAIIVGYHTYMLVTNRRLVGVKTGQYEFNRRRMLLGILLSGLFGMLAVLAFFQQVGFINYVTTERSMRYFLFSEAANFGFFVDFFATAFVLFSVYVIESNRDKVYRSLWLIILLLIPYIYFNIAIFSGSRITVIRPVLIVGFYWMLRSGATRLNWRIAILFVTLILFAMIGGIFRTIMAVDHPLDALLLFMSSMSVELAFNVATQAFDFSTTYDIFLMLNNQNFDFGLGDTYLKLLYQFIPRSLWLEKPENVTLVMSHLFRPEQFDLGVSYNPSLLGEMYYNFGLAGVVMGCFLVGIGISWLYIFGRNTIKSPPMVLIYAVLIVSIIEQGRGALSNITMTYVIFYILPILLMTRYSKASIKAQSPIIEKPTR
ncbi:O-antigen polymerase [Ferrovum myxofaciens]|uniref:O-antigen polymerase n=1 Tax=Ferrovum myxofaciens TaxID=416213 RepID=UPI003EBF8C59